MPEVQMPRLSDTMTEGVLSQWLKAEGDLIRKGDVIAEIETDKATMELEAYDSGPLTALLVTEDPRAIRLSVSSIPAPTWAYLTSLEWVRARENLALVGPPGQASPTP